MGKHENGDRVALDVARRTLLALARTSGEEEIASEAAVGRITAAPVVARFASPHYRGAAMDGIALSAAATRDASPGTPRRLREIGPHDRVDSTSKDVCVVVDTGNALPDWADAVLRNEATRREGDDFVVTQPVPSGRDVRMIGEDVAAGAPLLPRGHLVRPLDVGALLATGVTRLGVRRRPTVAILATGGEVVEPGDEPRPGEVIEYNSRLLAGNVAEWGGEPRYLGRSADDLALLTTRVRAAAAEFDLTCVIAGSSHGRKDFTLEARASAGGEGLALRGIGMMPGKPTGLAVVGGKPVLAVPGYPVSAALSCRELVAPFLAAMLGMPEAPIERARAIVRRDTPSKLGTEELLRVCLAADGDALVVAPLPRGAGSVTTLLRADAILRIPSMSEGIGAGSTVDVELVRPHSEIGRTVVAAGLPDALGATLEDACRRAGLAVRWAYLGLADLDAINALAAGEAHLACFDDAPACGVPDASALLDARVPGWHAYDVRSGSSRVLLALAPGFLRTPLAVRVVKQFDAAASVGLEIRRRE